MNFFIFVAKYWYKLWYQKAKYIWRNFIKAPQTCNTVIFWVQINSLVTIHYAFSYRNISKTVSIVLIKVLNYPKELSVFITFAAKLYIKLKSGSAGDYWLTSPVPLALNLWRNCWHFWFMHKRILLFELKILPFLRNFSNFRSRLEPFQRNCFCPFDCLLPQNR